mgnify:CR=1 FL=1
MKVGLLTLTPSNNYGGILQTIALYSHLESLGLKYLVGAEATGIYNSSVLLLMMIYLLPGSIYQKYLLPKFHYWVNQDTKQVDRIYNIGNIVMPYTDCTKRVCFIIVSGEDLIDARKNMVSILDLIEINTTKLN